MKREIKFRAWSKTENRWIYDGYTIKEMLANGYELDGKDLEWVEWTGLLDRNGKEIFEGDIVKLDSWEPKIWQVGFDRGGFCFYREGDTFYHDCKYLEGCEVIGDIYTTPELLK